MLYICRLSKAHYPRRVLKMKYMAFFVVALFAFGGCASTSSQDQTANAAQAQAQVAQPAVQTVDSDGIIDEEYDLLVAPQFDYNADIPYADQIKTEQATKPQATKGGSAKSLAKPAAIKK